MWLSNPKKGSAAATADAFRDLRAAGIRASGFRPCAYLELSRPAPENSGGADRLGDEAEHRDHEKPQSEVPHALKDRTGSARP